MARRLDGRAMRGQEVAGREGQIEPLLVRAQERGKGSCRVKPLPTKAKEATSRQGPEKMKQPLMVGVSGGNGMP